MPRIKIKQMGNAIATSGIHLGGGQERRKLEPGEVLELDEDLLMDDGRSLFHALWETGKIELTPEPATRPLDYANVREAKLTSGNFKSRGPDDDAAQAKAVADVRERMLEANMHEDEVLPEVPEPIEEAPAVKPPAKPASRRQRRRAKASGQQATA